MEVCCCCCPTGCQRDWKKAQWVCLEGCRGMVNSFTAGRAMLKWPFCYKGTTPTQKMCSAPLPASGPILQRFSCSQTPATSALVAPGPAWGHCHWLQWPVLRQGARSSAPQRLPLRLCSCAGWPPAGQAPCWSPLGWSVARAIVLLLSVHHPQDWQLHSYGVIVASSAGNGNKAQYWHWKTPQTNEPQLNL